MIKVKLADDCLNVQQQEMVKDPAVALLLEDEPLISMELEQTLEEAGFIVMTAMSCCDAEAFLQVFIPDVVLVDVILRDGSSDQIVQQLVEHDIPFIVHSGQLLCDFVGTPFAHGRWLGKPAAPGDLANAARAVIATPSR